MCVCLLVYCFLFFFFFFNDTATTEIYTLSLHDALPIYGRMVLHLRGETTFMGEEEPLVVVDGIPLGPNASGDRKSTRLNSSHSQISYAVFCLKKKNCHNYTTRLIYTAMSKLFS